MPLRRKAAGAADAEKIRGKAVDVTGRADDTVMVFKAASDSYEHEVKGAPGAHASTHETGGTDKVHFGDLEHDEADSTLHDSYTGTPHISQAEKDRIHDRLHALSSASDHTGEITDAQHGVRGAGLHADSHPRLHQASHQSGGEDALDGILDAVARTTVRKNSGADVGSRRRLNLIEGSNVTLTVEDDPANEEIDVTIASTGAGGPGKTYKLAPSYTIYTDGTTIYAMDEDGNIDYSGTDAAAVINSAINALPAAKGGKVLVKAGEYNLNPQVGNAAIVIQGKENIVFEGEGWKSTKLIVQGGDTIAILIGDRSDAAKASTEIIVRGFYIDGSAQTTETSAPEENDRRFGIEVATPSGKSARCLIENNYIYKTGSDSVYLYGLATEAEPHKVVVRKNIINGTRGFWASIHGHGGSNVGTFVGNIIINSEVGGIRHGHQILNNFIFNCGRTTATEGQEAGIVGGGRNGCLIKGNWIYGRTGGGVKGIKTWEPGDVVEGNVVYVSGPEAVAIYVEDHRCIVSGNMIGYALGAIGIEVRAATGVVVKGNLFNTVRWGIVLKGGRRCVVQGNVLYQIGYGENNTYDCIRLQTYDTTTHSTYNIISSNQIYSDHANKPRYGIVEADANQDYNIFAHNIVSDCVTGRILVQGVHSVQDNNIEG